MTFQKTSFLQVCACIYLATLIAAAMPARIHEARQEEAISSATSAASFGPGPVSIRTPSSTSTTPETTTMSPTPTSEPPLSSSSSVSSPSLVASPYTQIPSSPSSSSTPLSPTSVSPSPTYETPSAAPQPSPSTSSLSFAVQNLTTCTPGVISWKYSGQEADLHLSVTNIGIPQNDDSVVVFQQLADTNTSTLSWTWPSVNVTQGWYVIQGRSAAAISVNPASFFVSNGTDVSCLTGTLLHASSMASPSPTVLPAVAASKPNVAGIAGGVIGGVLSVALAIMAVVCLWVRRRRRPFIRRGGNRDRTWGSLKSTTSSIRPESNGAQLASNHFHAHSESTGAILQDLVGGQVSTTTTPGGSDEDVLAVSEEKAVSSASCPGLSPFDALNTPIHYDRRASTYSIQTPTSAVTSDPFRSRVPSVRTSAQSLEQQAQRIRSSMETSTRRRSERLSMPTLPSPGLSRIPHSPTRSQPTEEYPLTPVTPTPVNRSISAGAVSMTARRTSRKPVPHYDPSLLLESKSADSVSTSTGGADSSQSHGAGLGTGAHGTPSDLVHKASFGDGRPVHYLIPDLPPPQQD